MFLQLPKLFVLHILAPTYTSKTTKENRYDDASRTSTYAGVRDAVLGIERSLAQTGNFVVEGRDIGTVVFPDAELKIFLTADSIARAERRWDQWMQDGLDPGISFEQLVAQIEERDARDASRDIAPLEPAPDAVLLDNSKMTIEETIDFILSDFG